MCVCVCVEDGCGGQKGGEGAGTICGPRTVDQDCWMDLGVGRRGGGGGICKQTFVFIDILLYRLCY